jgi:hypothetical protein
VAWSACSDSTYTLKIVLEPAAISLWRGMTARGEDPDGIAVAGWEMAGCRPAPYSRAETQGR